MKRIWKRLIASALTMVLLVNLLPLSALATLMDNTPDYNREILAQLEEICGSEDEAELYYALLQQYGLLDEDGRAVEHWDILLEGEQVTLDDLRAVLAGDYAPDAPVMVDGQILTLGNVDTILQIENYLAYLQDTYYTGHQWSAEQRANLDSLMDQIEKEGIQIYSDTSALLIGGSGVSHSARVSVTPGEVTGSTVPLTAVLSDAAPGQVVKFNWQALSGSRPASGSGTVTLTADEAGSAKSTVTVTLGDVSTEGASPVRSTADLSYYVKLDNITNALFADGQNSKDAMILPFFTGGTVTEMPALSEPLFTVSGTGSLSEGAASINPYQRPLIEEEKRLLQWGIADSVIVKQDTYSTADDRGVGYYGAAKNGTIPITEDSFAPIIEFANAQSLNDVYLTVYKMSSSATSGEQSWEGERVRLGVTSFNEPKDVTGETKITEYLNFSDQGSSLRDVQSSPLGDEIKLSGLRVNEFYLRLYKPDPTQEQWKLMTERISTTRPVPIPLPATAKFHSKRPPEVLSFSAPQATYLPGQTVPVAVTFSELVVTDTASVKFNGQAEEYPAVERNGYSNVLTFLYTVQETDNTDLSLSSVTATDQGGNTLTSYNPGGDVGAGQLVENVTFSGPVESHAITGVTAVVNKDAAGQSTLQVDVAITDNQKLNQWLKGTPEDGTSLFYAEGLTVSLDGNQTSHKLFFKNNDAVAGGLTATIPLEENTGTEPILIVPELYRNDALMLGKAAGAEQAAVKFIEAKDLSATISIQTAGGAAYEFEDEKKPVIYVQQDMPKIKATIGLQGTDFSFGDTDKVAVVGGAGADTADFLWASSDLTVVQISADGQITPTGKAGTAQITLTARNGGVEGKAVVATATYQVASMPHDTLTFAAGLTPFLSIPNATLRSRDGQAVTVYWTSNLCDKNGATPTTFTVAVQRVESGEPYIETVTGTASAPAASHTIPGTVLGYDYDGGKNQFTVTVTATYSGVEYSAKAIIDLEAKPAQVGLGKLGSYYILDTVGEIPITWSVENLEQVGDKVTAETFQFQITRNSADISTSMTPKLENGEASGTIPLTIADIKADPGTPTSYRDVYTVTIQAKNGADSTWSYDSFLLYVYDDEAMQIMVDGSKKDSLTMSNRNAIKAMDQAQILALKRDIHLKNIISVNYGQYAWGEIADQIAWASGDDGVATVNYQQGTLYENINKFSYTSYRPTTDLGLGGVRDGKTDVTATHKLTGMEDVLPVTVETLKDRLYLFQCYPQQITTLAFEVYTSEEKKETKPVTVESDSTGAAAYYAEYGIASDVYCSSGTGSNHYLGTFYRADLKTGEGDWTRMERYPCNNLNLRRAAYAYVYLKKPDGTPYTGSLTFRGGVYVNGMYKEKALFALNGAVVNQRGDQDQPVTLGSDGKLTILMDQMQWDLPGQQVSVTDKVTYELQFSQRDGTDYYPILYTIDATTNADAYVGSGQAVVTFRENPKTGKHPFIAAQTGVYEGYGTDASLLNFTGKVGPNDSLTETSITTSVMWWGEEITGTPSLRLVTDKTWP